jgi:protein Tex
LQKKHTTLELRALVGQSSLLKSLKPEHYADEKFGIPTINDILKELEKPGRDPRPEFTTATFKDGVEAIKDLRPDMILEGVVTNVAAFGAFVDIGVHQDGLVHISALSSQFVKDPHSIVKAGQVVRVKVLEVDEKRKRISLTMRLSDAAPAPAAAAANLGSRKSNSSGKTPLGRTVAPPIDNAMANAFARLKK